MTIYIVQWTAPADNVGNYEAIPKRYADSSYGRAKVIFNEQRKKSAESNSRIDIGDEEEALTKHSITTQKEVIDLINSLN